MIDWLTNVPRAICICLVYTLDALHNRHCISIYYLCTLCLTCGARILAYCHTLYIRATQYESRILSFERKCYRKILRIKWTQKVTNEELYRKIQLTETLLQKVIQRKLRLFGHICRMNDSRKIKTLVFGMMDGSNERGRPHWEWSDNIEQWCGTTLQELNHAALDRQRWAAIVRMASDTNRHWAHGCRWWWWRINSGKTIDRAIG